MVRTGKVAIVFSSLYSLSLQKTVYCLLCSPDQGVGRR